jgi:hypothetical protein
MTIDPDKTDFSHAKKKDWYINKNYEFNLEQQKINNSTKESIKTLKL